MNVKISTAIRRVSFVLTITATLFATIWLISHTPVVTAATANVIINEVDADNSGTDTAEFIELYDGGDGNTPLDGLSIVLFNGSDDASYEAFDLDGQTTDAHGYFVLCVDATEVPNCDFDVPDSDDNLIQNGADAVALFVDDAVNFPEDTPITTTNLQDAMVYDTDDSDDAALLALINAGQPQLNEGGNGDKDNHSNQRCPNGDGGAFNTDSYTQTVPTPGSANCLPFIAVSKTAEAPLLATGLPVTYTIIASNLGITDDTVVITDELPADIEFSTWVEQPAGATETAGTINWTGLISAAESVTLTFIITNNSTAGTTITNTVNVSGTASTATADAAFTTVQPLGVTKEAPQYGLIGGSLVYTVTIENAQNVTANNVVFTDTFPTSVSYIEDNSGIVPTVADQTYVWAIGDVPALSSVNVNITVSISSTLTAGATFTNTAEVNDGTHNDTSQVETTVYELVTIQEIQEVANPSSDDASPLLSQTVFIEGVVTAAPGEIDVNTRLMYIQDEAGGSWSGIAVFRSSNIPAELIRGTQVQLLGTVSEFNGTTQFNLLDNSAAIQVLGTTSEPTAELLTTGEFDDADQAVSEQWEGVLIAFQNATVTDDDLGFSEWYFDDGSGEARADDLGDRDGDLTYSPSNGDVYNHIQGIGAYAFGNYKLLPRNDGDIDLSSVELVSTSPRNGATNVPTDTNIILTFDEPVTVTSDIAMVVCTINEAVDYTTDPAVSPSAVYTLTLDVNLESGEICAVTILADAVSNSTGAGLPEDVSFSFSTVGYTTSMICGDPAVAISFVQGSGMASPLNGTDNVILEGVITARFDTLDGFYMQEETADDDRNEATSEAIFVYDPSNTITNSVGTIVRLEADISEFNGATQAASVSDSAVCGSDTIEPTEVNLPLASADEWEQYESMLIILEQELIVTDHFRLGRYGQIRLSADSRLQQPTSVTSPGMAANNLQDLNDRSFITVDDANPDQNPDPVIYPDPMLTYSNTLRGGDSVSSGVVGIMYEFNGNSADDYRLYPTEPIRFTHSNPRTEAPVEVSGTIKVASFNVLNYFTTLDTGAQVCGPIGGLDCRGAEDEEEFTRQRTKIINAIVAMDADIIGLMEIENHTTDNALIDLVDGLNEATSAGTYAYIDTGAVGTDAIKVALIYKPANVTPMGVTAILDSSVDSDFIDTKNRPVVIQTFSEVNGDGVVTVAVNHLKSKGSSCDDVNDPNLDDGQGNCNLTREAAAQALADYLTTDPTGSGSDNFLIIGDLNAYAMEDPIVVLEDAGYTNLIRQFNGVDAYGYTFDGQWGYLDHALASASLLPQVTGVTEWHINADEPVILDYNTNFKSANQIDTYYGPGPYRASDHDPVIVGLELVAPSTTIYLPLILVE